MTLGLQAPFDWTRRRRFACGVLVAFCCASAFGEAVAAKTLTVGPTRELKLPSDAAAVAVDGDVIEIEPSKEKEGYFDCAVLKASHLTVVGKGDGVILTDKACQGKAIFVTVGSDITIRNITLTRARVPDKMAPGSASRART
jgi:hypothetical protein